MGELLGGVAAKGLYLLLLRVPAGVRLHLPAAGPEPTEVPTGWCVYVGSARGAGGLRSRLAHHLRPVTRPHWHIDRLRLAGAIVVGVLTIPDAPGGARPLTEECAVAARLAKWPGAHRNPARFGSSDCRCPGHLIHWGDGSDRMGQRRRP